MIEKTIQSLQTGVSISVLTVPLASTQWMRPFLPLAPRVDKHSTGTNDQNSAF